MLPNSVGFRPKTITLGRKKTNITELTHQVREIRNLVHPGQWAREPSAGTRIDKELYESVYDVGSWLLYRILKSLFRHMKREGLI